MDTSPASRLHPASRAPIPPPGHRRCPLIGGAGWTVVHSHADGDRQHAGCHLTPTWWRRLQLALLEAI